MCQQIKGKMREASYTILAPGFAKWWGSDGRALAQSFRRLGHKLIEIDEEDYVPWRWDGIASKLLRRAFVPIWSADYNRAVMRHASSSGYDFVLAFKGNLLKPETIRRLSELGKPVYNFYPDTNFRDYGNNIPGALRFYNCVFTTKSFHGERELRDFAIRNLQHVRHGFDPEVHRPVQLSTDLERLYRCDVSFVGHWSPEYETRLVYLMRQRPDVHLRVYGLGWNHSSAEFRQRIGDNLRPAAYGDELAIVYCSSKVNLAFLRRATVEQNISDQSTARTFQIPATRSLMLHEDTAEVRTLFETGKEVLLFESNEDLISKIDLSLSSPLMRETISLHGYNRCIREPYDYSAAAHVIVNYFEGRETEAAKFPLLRANTWRNSEGRTRDVARV